MYKFKNIDIKKLIKRTAAIILAAVCILSLCACSGSSVPAETLSDSERKENLEKAKSNRKVHKTMSDMLGFDIGDEFIDELEMSSDDIKAETYGKIRIIVKNGKEAELLKLLKDNLGDYRNIDVSHVPSYQEHPYAYELKHMSSIKNWVRLKSGVVAKTVDINVYMAELNGDTIVYIFG